MDKKGWKHIGLSKKQICFLDKLSNDSKFSGGRKFSRTAILRTFLTAIQDFNIDVNNVKSEKELKEKILMAFKGKSIKRKGQ
jgi:hypothetical protein